MDEKYVNRIDPEYINQAFPLMEPDFSVTDFVFLSDRIVRSASLYIDDKPAMCAYIAEINGLLVFGGAVTDVRKFTYSRALKYARRLLEEFDDDVVVSMCARNNLKTVLTLGGLKFMIYADDGEYLYFIRNLETLT